MVGRAVIDASVEHAKEHEGRVADTSRETFPRAFSRHLIGAGGVCFWNDSLTPPLSSFFVHNQSRQPQNDRMLTMAKLQAPLKGQEEQ